MSEDVKIIDIPKEVGEELKRLHEVLLNASGLGWEDRRKWAKEQITMIHNAYFKAQIMMDKKVIK
jgi:hypothetical protein